MKSYRILLVCLVILLLGFSFLPVFAFPLKVDVSWQQFAEAYTDPNTTIYLPLILR